MNPWVRFVRFNTVGALGIGVQLAAIWLLADVAGVHYLFATPAAVGLAVVHNFIWHWWWTWHDRAEAGGLAAAFVRFAVANGALSLVGNLGVMATLVSGAHVEPVVASGVAIGVCGLLNFWLGDAVVFRRAQPQPLCSRSKTPVRAERPGLPPADGRPRCEGLGSGHLAIRWRPPAISPDNARDCRKSAHDVRERTPPCRSARTSRAGL